MRRVFAILMVVMLLPAAVYADDMTRKDYFGGIYDETKGYVEVFIELYDERPDIFDADIIVMAYGYMTTYLALRRVYMAEMLFNLKTEGRVMMREAFGVPQIEEEKGYALIERTLSDKFYKWAGGEMTDAEFAEIVINMCRSLTKEVEVPQT